MPTTDFGYGRALSPEYLSYAAMDFQQRKAYRIKHGTPEKYK